MENFKNNICIVGKDVNKIKEELDLFREENKKKIENNWDIFSCGWDNIIELIKSKNTDYKKEKFSFTIIISLDNLDDMQNDQKASLNILFQSLDRMLMQDEISEYNFPFFIILVQKEEDIIDLKNEFLQYNNIDKRNISFFISPLKDASFKKNIKIKILKIFSYFYGLGDEWEYEGKKFKLYKETQEDLLPVNILVIGRSQVGKSTFINTILNEKRAKEGDNNSNETEKLLTYHVDGVPLLINDIEGFTGEKNINEVINDIRSMQHNFHEKELHLIIYVLRYENGPYFNDNEYEIFKQLSKGNHQSHFIFLCTRAGNKQEKVYKDIKKSFFRMIQKGLKNECKDEKSKFINTLNYLYYCQKKEIDYNEIGNNSIKMEEFNKLEFYKKMELKFKGRKEEERNEEMISTIIEKDKNLIFVNLKKEEDHEIKFGMDKVCSQIINAFRNIKSFNMKFLNDELAKSESKIYNINGQLNDNKIYDDEERQNLISQKNELDESKEDYMELINSLNNENDLKKCRKSAERLKLKLVKEANENLKLNKLGGWISGILPFVDIYIQHLIKENAKKKISDKFDDNLVDFDQKNLNLTKKQEKSIKEVKNKVDDTTSDILKSLGRAFTIGINIFSKISFFALAGVGVGVGVVVGGAVTHVDINALLKFYGDRFIYRCLICLSFKKIADYLVDNIANQNEN